MSRGEQSDLDLRIKARVTRQDTGAPSRNRTYDTGFRKPLLYPLSYGG
jgi:hypothetical protein